MLRFAGKIAFITGAGGGIGRAIALQCDAGEADSVRAAIARTVAAFGGLNVLWFARTWVSQSPWAAGRTGR